MTAHQAAVIDLPALRRTSAGSLMSTVVSSSSRSVMPLMGNAAAGGRPLCKPTTPAPRAVRLQPAAQIHR